MLSIKAVTGHVFFVTRFINTVARLNADSTKAISLFIALQQPEIVQAAVADDVCLYFRVALRLLTNVHAAICLSN